MKRLSIALALAAAAIATPAAAANVNHPARAPATTGSVPGDQEIGLDGFPPSPLCRASLGPAMIIHCIHNMVWHGGPHYIDDLGGTTAAKH